MKDDSCAVWMASAVASQIEWVTRTGSTVKGPTAYRSRGRTVTSCARAEHLVLLRPLPEQLESVGGPQTGTSKRLRR